MQDKVQPARFRRVTDDFFLRMKKTSLPTSLALSENADMRRSILVLQTGNDCIPK
jgi:hypothetical protein